MKILHKISLPPQQVDYIYKKGPTADVWLDSKGAPDWCVVIFFLLGSQRTPVF